MPGKIVRISGMYLHEKQESAEAALARHLTRDLAAQLALSLSLITPNKPEKHNCLPPSLLPLFLLL
jgi:hypothetical protein